MSKLTEQGVVLFPVRCKFYMFSFYVNFTVKKNVKCFDCFTVKNHDPCVAAERHMHYMHSLASLCSDNRKLCDPVAQQHRQQPPHGACY